MNKELRWVLIWTLSIIFNIFALGKLLYTIVNTGLQSLKVKKRPNRPEILTDKRFGEHRYVVVEKRGIRLHYVEKGDDSLPLIVLVHGFPQCWFTWRNQLESLSDQYRVVAVDLPGYGDSDKPTRKEAYDVEQLTEDLKHFILTLGVSSSKKCILIGHDWGSVLCWVLVEKYPELFNKHVCIDGCQLYVMNTMMQTNINQFFKSWYVFMFQMPYLPELMIRIHDLENYAKNLRGPDNDTEAFPDDVIEAYKYFYSQKGSFTGPINYYRRAFHYEAKKPKDKIKVPTLIIWAEKDQALSTQIAIKTLPLVETVELKIVKNTYHFLPELKPAIVTDTIRTYLTPS